MNIAKIVLGLAILFIASATGVAQQQIVQTVTKANKSCNSTCSVIDIPELNGNPAAIIFITPVGNSSDLNPHPIGAYFMYMKKWSVFNLDGVTITDGARFNVEYYAAPGPDRFAYTVPQRQKQGEPSYIDHVGLNFNPNAQVRVFPASSPTRGALFNRGPVKVEYDPVAFKWFIANVDGTPVMPDTVYNVSISAGGIADVIPTRKDTTITDAPKASPTPRPTPVAGVPVIPADLPPVRGSIATRRWVLRDDLKPSIPANSEILLFIHGMDSRAEEADDITHALFALKASGYSPVADPPPPPPTTAEVAAGLNQLLQKYKACIFEKYETKIDMVNRGLSVDSSGLYGTTGLQPRDSMTCVAGNPCSIPTRQAGFLTLQAQANSGNAVGFETLLKSIVPQDCFQCTKHAEWHTKHVHCTMEVGGNSGLKGLDFEACKAGVDASQLLTIIINEIHTAISNIGKRPEITGGPTIATNFSTVHFTNCPDPTQGCPETCDHPDSFSNGTRAAVLPTETVEGQQVPMYYEPMVPRVLLDAEPVGGPFNVPAAHNIGKNEGRLRSDLRSAAAEADPLKTLRLAAYRYAAGETVLAQAFADLSVTGRKTFEAFRRIKPQEEFCTTVASERPATLSAAGVTDGCHTALDRAYRVANFLRTGQRGDTPAAKKAKTDERKFLGWIAVSGEDDQPHRPVNVPSSDFPQYDVDVNVIAMRSVLADKNIKVRTRYIIAQSKTANPNSPAKNLVVISLDLPTSGYTDNLNFNVVSKLTDIGGPKWTQLPIPIPLPPGFEFLIPGVTPAGIPPGFPIPDFQATGQTPVLSFVEDFIASFSNTLEQEHVVNSADFRAVMGGSLGGNMTFRLGRRANLPWPKFIVWSPASIWSSMGEGGDILKHIGPRKAFESADQAANQPTDTDRAMFFGGWDKPILPFVIPMAQSDSWTSDYYPCKLSSVAGARLDRQETYDKWFLAWHWRLGGEQLLYSHQNKDQATQLPLYMLNKKPMLLGCGTEDHVAFNDICPATERTAPLMLATPGKAIFMDKTGHSLDNERRDFWAREILKFLNK